MLSAPGEEAIAPTPIFGRERTRPKVKYCAIEYIGHTFGSPSKLCHTLFVLVSHIIFLVKLLCAPRVLRPGATAPLCPPLVTPLKATKWQNLFRFNSLSNALIKQHYGYLFHKPRASLQLVFGVLFLIVYVRPIYRQAASQVSHTATDDGPPTSANHCRTPSIRCARPHGLKLSAGRPPRTAGLRVLQTGSELKPGFSPDTSVSSALKTFVIIALYKSTFTIPYQTIDEYDIRLIRKQ